MGTSRVVALTHKFSEDSPSTDNAGQSKVNKFEADFLVGLAKYLIQRGNDPRGITILTTYLGQMAYINQVQPLTHSFSVFTFSDVGGKSQLHTVVP